jgi:hypothetical protein
MNLLALSGWDLIVIGLALACVAAMLHFCFRRI